MNLHIDKLMTQPLDPASTRSPNSCAVWFRPASGAGAWTRCPDVAFATDVAAMDMR